MPESPKEKDLGIEDRAVEVIQKIETDTEELYDRLEVKEKMLGTTESVSTRYKELTVKLRKEDLLNAGLDEKLLGVLYEKNPDGNFLFTVYRGRPEAVYRHFFRILNAGTGIGLIDSSRREPFLATTIAADDSCCDGHRETFGFLMGLYKYDSKSEAIEAGLKNVNALLKAVESSISS